MPIGHLEDLLILAKTYPNPSKANREISCVAAINRQRQIRRLFPLPFRFLQGDQQFKKWQWIRARINKASKDHRPESHTIDRDSIEKGEIIPSTDSWRHRLQWIQTHIYETPEILEQKRKDAGVTLGFVRPTKLVQLEISESGQPDWTEEEKHNLQQDSLFDPVETHDKILLRKVPYDFHYLYEVKGPAGLQQVRHKITDWEAGALYWNCQRSHGKDWEKAFRQRMETEFSKKDLLFLLGTMHRFPDQWLIVAFNYPTKPELGTAQQLDLLT